MPTMQTVKRRITSVSNTQQITEAMNHIAASKLQRAKSQLNSARSLFDETKRVIDNLTNSEEALNNVFAKPREVKHAAYVVISSDRGMCGAYNTNVSKAAMSLIEKDNNEQIIAIGTRGWDFFRRRGRKILRKYTSMSDSPFYTDAEIVGRLLMSLYLKGEIDEAYVAYTKFESTLTHIPCVSKILPLSVPDNCNDNDFSTMKYDPDLNTVLHHFTPLYLNAFIYGAMVESSVCEEAARMISMDSATNNATDIIEDLTLMYNRMRQDAITQELNEIIGGASALE